LDISRIAKKAYSENRKMPGTEIDEWTQKLELLKEELSEKEKALPAHSIRPHQLQAIEELEERIKALREKIKASRTDQERR
jgi:hypothetical protein